MQNKWYETFFEGVANEFWVRVMPAALTVQDAEFLVRALDVKPGAKLLDLACGNGRHTNELARRGFSVTGVDLSDDFLARARAAAVDGAEFVKGDLRDLRLEGRFAGAYCMGNTIPYFDREELGVILSGVARLLGPGAKLVIEEGATAESLLPTLQRQRWVKVGDILFLSENRYVARESRLDIDYTFVQDGKIETRPSSSYILTTAELCGIFEASGFEVLELASGPAGEPYVLGSPRLLLTARTLGGDV